MYLAEHESFKKRWAAREAEEDVVRRLDDDGNAKHMSIAKRPRVVKPKIELAASSTAASSTDRFRHGVCPFDL